MLGRTALSAVVAFACCFVGAAIAHAAGEEGGAAGEGGSPPPPPGARPVVTGSVEHATISAEVGVTWVESVPSGSPPSRPACTYTLARPEESDDPADAADFSPRPTSYRKIGSHEPVEAPGPGVEQWMRRQCRPPLKADMVWVPVPEAVDVGRLAASAYSLASAQVPTPELQMWPPPEIGAPVQLGLWLAVDEPGQINAVAQVGNVWASVSATFTGMTWDMGNGDVVSCDGAGVPHPTAVAPGDYSQGPCGYTYRRASDLGTRAVTATANFDVRLITSTGRDESLDPIAASSDFAFEVYEIVTVVGG